MSKAKASNQQFSQVEEAFFEEGDTLADSPAASYDFSDLDPREERTTTWAERALAVLSMVTPARSSS